MTLYPRSMKKEVSTTQKAKYRAIAQDLIEGPPEEKNRYDLERT